jgi:hypothetical protein
MATCLEVIGRTDSERVRDILIGAILGIELWLIGGLWAQPLMSYFSGNKKSESMFFNCFFVGIVSIRFWFLGQIEG